LYSPDTPPVVPELSSPLEELPVVVAVVVVVVSEVVAGVLVVVVVSAPPPVVVVDVVVASTAVLEPVSAATAPSSTHADRPSRRRYQAEVSRFAIGFPIA
jgi:hypothetical protein